MHMALSIEYLSAYLRSLNHRRVDEDENSEALPWNTSQLLAVYCYVINFCSNSENHRVYERIIALDDLASCFIFDPETEDLNKFLEMVASLMPDLQKFFKVQDGLIVSFIGFLLQILDHSSNVSGDYPFRILEQELKFLLTVLGDGPVLFSDYGEISNLLEEFEHVANEAGMFIFSSFFDMDRSTYTESIIDLLGKIEFLKGEIKDFCVKFSKLSINCITTQKNGGCSLFIVHALIDDLEDLMSCGVDLTDDLKDLLRTLYEELKVLRFFPEIMKLPKSKEKQIKVLAYQAEYQVNSLVVGDIQVWYFTLRIQDIVEKLKDIRFQFEEITKEINFDNGVAKIAQDFRTSFQEKKGPMVDTSMFGFEEGAMEMLDLLIGGPKELQIISMVGVTGLGKTTLAKKLYDDPLVVHHFDKRGWGFVSQMYHRGNLLVDMDKKTISKESIYGNLLGRRYLLVLDDIWHPIVWDDLRRCFPNDRHGSRILITSSFKDVAPSGSIIRSLPFLSLAQSWDLLIHKAFGEDHPCPPFLIDVGMRIARFCNGLPLAVVVAAGILANMDKEETEWRKVEQCLESCVFVDPKGCTKVLELGYEHLPDHLKPCLLYFVAFPEEAEIPTWKLIGLWIAEGFVHKGSEEKSLEEIGEEYLMELIGRSLVVVSTRGSDGGVKAVRVHDLLLEMCLRKAEDENFLKLVEDHLSMYEQHHHHYHRLCTYPSSSPPLCGPFELHLRAYLGHLPDPFFCFPSMKLARILHIPTKTLNKYEEERIRHLSNLRYLAISRMPSSTGSFLKLEFLHVESSTLVTIPLALLQILKLRYLHIEPQAKFDEDCTLITQANNLRTLSFIRISKLEEESILRYSPHLRKLKLHVFSPSFPGVCFLSSLESLKIEFQNLSFWSGFTDINFPTSIRKLSLSKTGLLWEKITVIASLPNLEVLKLVCDAFTGERWTTRNGEFRQLKSLTLEGLRLDEWRVGASEHFPKLERLVLRHCYSLVKIPSVLCDLASLMIEVHYCPVIEEESSMKLRSRKGSFITSDMW